MENAIKKIRWKVDYLKTADNHLVVVKGILNYKIGEQKNSHANDLKLNLYQNLTKKLQPHLRKVKFKDVSQVEPEIELALRAELNVFGYEFSSFTFDWHEIKTLKELRKHVRKKIVQLHTGEYLNPFVNEFKPLFAWNDVPGNDDDKLKKFLKDDLGINCVDSARIIKINNNKQIKVLLDKKHVSLILDNPNLKPGETMEVKLKTDDHKTDILIAKFIKGKLSVYKPKRYKQLSSAIDDAVIYFIRKSYGEERRVRELGEEWRNI